jgi:diguanylate cyclase (GGDEF)-like protein
MADMSAAAAPAISVVDELNLRVQKLENRLQREKRARLKAEEIAERGLSELYVKQQQILLLETIATAANQSTSVEETMRFALEAICRHTGWVLGNVYLPAPDGGGGLEHAGIWHANDPEHFQPFISLTLATKFRSGEGLPGRVFQSCQPAWIADVAQDGNFPRVATASLVGCRAGFAFPVLLNKDVLAVLEFFHHNVIGPDEQLLSIMAQVGSQLGRVMERRSAEQKLMHDATHDPLTALPNRLLFSDRLERVVATHKRRPEIGFAVIFIDLDRFKLVNDSLGHAAGDDLLQEIARRFDAVLSDPELSQRRGNATLARLGGDEFTVLLEDVDRSSVSVETAQALQEALRAPIVIEGQEVYPSASFGVASSEAGHANAADIIRAADLAMYRAKSEGRNRIEIFDKSLHLAAQRRLTLESNLRSALKKKEFVLHYQPIVALNSHKTMGFEALVRWQRPDGALIPPNDFIPIAEETGLIAFIGAWVLKEALGTLAQWQTAHPREVPLSMSVNVSPRQFHQADFVDQVIQIVTSSGVPPSSVRLEITEGVTIVDAERAIAILGRLRAFGVRVSIDDFGTGYSSLRYLHELPFDTLKIDKSFVAALETKVGGEEIIQTILDLARNLKLEVVAEGTETSSHVETLHRLGCGYAQGFFFSRPLDAANATMLLERSSGVALEPFRS